MNYYFKVDVDLKVFRMCQNNSKYGDEYSSFDQSMAQLAAEGKTGDQKRQ